MKDIKCNNNSKLSSKKQNINHINNKTEIM